MLIVRADASLNEAHRRELTVLGCEAFVLRADERARFSAQPSDRFLFDGILDDPAFAFDEVTFDRLFETYLATRDSNATARPRCTRRDPARTQLDQRAIAGRDLLRSNPLAMLLPSELSWTRGSDPLDLCYCEACVAAWQLDLAKRFPNAETAASRLGLPVATRFEDLRPSTVDRIRARNDGNSPSEARLGAWLDYRRSLDRGLASRVAELAETLSPQRFPFVGWLGGQPTNPFGGHDWSLLGRALSVLQPPDDPTSREVVYSLAFTGSAPLVLIDLRPFGGRERFIRRRLIDQFFHGARGALVPRVADLVDAEGKRTSFAEKVGARLAWLDSEAAAHWVAAIPEVPRVGILYSPTSVAVHWLIDAESDGIYWPTRARTREGEILPMVGTWWGWQFLLEDVGMAYRFVPEQDLSDGNALDGLSALILPRAIALSDEDVRRIEAFVERGGLLLIDGECAMFDALGNGRDRSPFDELCAVERSSIPKYWDLRAHSTEPAPKLGEELTAQHHLRDLETNVEVGPGATKNVRWLDLALEDYVLWRGAPSSAIESVRREVAAFLAPARAEHEPLVTRVDGGSPTYLRRFLATDGDVTYVALVRNDLLPEFLSASNVDTGDGVIDYVLELGREASIRDLAREGAEPTVGRRVEFSLPADGFALFRIAPP